MKALVWSGTVMFAVLAAALCVLVVVTVLRVYQDPPDGIVVGPGFGEFQKEMDRSCQDWVRVAAEVVRSDMLRDAAYGVESRNIPLFLRQVFASGAVASELYVRRCMEWMGRYW